MDYLIRVMSGHFARLAGAVPKILLKRAGAKISCPMPILYLDVTARCNSRCLTCGFRDSSGNGKELDARAWIEVLKQARELGTSIVSFGGGEPFMREDFLDLLEAAAGTRAALHLNTNGTMLSEDRVRALDSIGVSAVTVSLDADDVETYRKLRGIDAFDQVTGGIRSLKEKAPKIHVIVETTVTRENVKRLEKIAGLAKKLGADQVKFTPAVTNLQHAGLDRDAAGGLFLGPEDRATVEEAINSLLRVLGGSAFLGNSARFLKSFGDFVSGVRPRHRCFAGTLFGNVDPLGAFFPCYDVTGDFNVTRRSLAEMWNDHGFDALRDEVRRCDRVCWNVGNAEPSLLLNPGNFLFKFKQGMREMKHYRQRTRA